MGLSGSLEDISIIDLMQLLGLSSKSGTLAVEQGRRRAEVGLWEGSIVAASITPRLMYMSDFMVESGRLDLETLHRALAIQRKEAAGAKPIGAILMEMGAVSLDQLQEALRRFIQVIVSEVASWKDGDFTFVQGSPEPLDNLRFLPETLTLEQDISAQELLLEAPQGLPSEGKPRWRVILLSSDLFLRMALKEALREKQVELIAPLTEEDLHQLLGEGQGRARLLVLDMNLGPEALREGKSSLGLLEDLRREWPEMGVIAFGSDPAVRQPVLEGGALLHLPCPEEPTMDSSQSFVLLLSQSIVEELGRRPEEPLSPRALDHLLVTLQGESGSVVVSSEVLGFVAAYCDRAILFQVHPKQLMGLLGLDASSLLPDPLSLTIPLHKGSLVAQVIQGKRALLTAQTDSDATLEKLFELIGKATRQEALLLPLVVDNRVIALIYADNGRLNASLGPLELFSILARHTGLLLENQFLRHKIQRFRRA